MIIVRVHLVAGKVRESRRTRLGRALGVLAVVSAISGAALVLLWARPVDRIITAEPTTERRSVVVPSTVAPLDEPTAPTTASTSASPPDTATTPASTPASSESPASTVTSPGDAVSESVPPTTGLADLLPPIDRGAAIPDAVAPRAAPVGVENTVFDSRSYPIRPIGLEDDGQLEIPDETEIGWYRYGATAGAPGATVLAAHVSWNNTTGPFFELGKMEPGSRISVTLDDGTAREYEVVERARYEKDQLPRDRIWRNTGPESLVLITCGGDFNPEIRRYRHNIVVYAVPVG